MPYKSSVRKREYQAEYFREYYRQHSLEIRQRSRTANKVAFVRNRRLIRAAKDRPCADCHGTFHFAAMQFDHVRGTKVFDIANYQTRSLRLLQLELAKCEVVCANCHAVRTYERAAAAAASMGVDGEPLPTPQLALW